LTEHFFVEVYLISLFKLLEHGEQVMLAQLAIARYIQ
jgi:hypothetical protein